MFSYDDPETPLAANRLKNVLKVQHLRGLLIFLKEGPMGGPKGGKWFIVSKTEEAPSNAIKIDPFEFWP